MLPLILILAALLSVVMMGGWLFQKLMRNGGWTDVAWSYGVGLVSVIGALWPLQGEISGRQWAAAALVGAWSLRLGTHLGLRVARHEGEDVRYAHLRKQWGAAVDRKMFGFLQIQAAAAIPLAAAVAAAAHRPGPLALFDLAALLVFAVSLIGEHVADAQLAAFKATNTVRNAICNRGLWAWSRHPNYFFEWLVWLAWPVMAVDLEGGWTWGWLTFAAPIFMYLLLRYGSGVPPLEAQMARSRGAAWTAYAARTSVFFPLSPRLSMSSRPEGNRT